MKLQIISDIHLEFGVRDFDFSNADILIMAGDLHLGQKGFEWISKEVKEKPVLYVLGNHEYYRNSYPKLLYQIKKSAKDTNVHVLENNSVCLEGITFHGCTLWTNFEMFGDPRIAGFECQQKMNDYYLIRRDPSYSKLRSIDTHLMHNESINWLKKSIDTSNTKTNVVITHHAPSIRSIAEKYRNNIISAAFASDLEEFINSTQPDLWVHGHVHTAFDYTIGNTRIVCNPVGYPGEKVDNYRDNLIVEITN